MNSVVFAAKLAAQKKQEKSLQLSGHRNFQMRTSFVKKNVTKEMRDERQAEIDVRKPHFKVLVNIFYELVSIQFHLLSLIVNNFEYIRYGEEFQDKKRMNKIGELFKEIKSINERMNEPFWDSLDGKIFDELRRESNDVLRIIALGCDRCLRESFKWDMIEEFIKTMPSKGLFDDQFVEQFRLR